MTYYVYILASKKNGVLFTGVTNNLARRVDEHRRAEIDSFTRQYHVHKLVYFEKYRDINAAILREKRVKKWNRQWKIKCIEENNPEWNDLAIHSTFSLQ
jgi:putative endonuclease